MILDKFVKIAKRCREKNLLPGIIEEILISIENSDFKYEASVQKNANIHEQRFLRGAVEEGKTYQT